jgi:ribulose-5-phosphate 4-epimerase/fuculose-1-phosphate aldolase
MKILLVGGTWTVDPPVENEVERSSSVICFVGAALRIYCEEHYGDNCEIDVHNGGCYYDLDGILNKTPEYDIVFWWANVPDNSLPKIRDVNEVAPHTMLVTSKRNDGDRYNFMELTQRALAAKANLMFEFKKEDYEYRPGHSEKMFRINVFDPLGCQWYGGFDVTSSIYAAMDRLEYLNSITRQKTVQSSTDKNLVLTWYFDQFKQEQHRSEKAINIPDEQEFIEIVRKHAETFYEIFNPGKDVKRFLGNASLRAQLNIDSTRCMRGMPSFKKDDMVFVSQRNIDKQFISLENFVPCYMEDGKLYYCGDKKPSVDAPIQVRLYEALPHINYIIHSHCYVDGARFTSKPIPCGAIEEVDEVLSLIADMDEEYLDATKNTRGCAKDAKPFMYAINLKGHGSLVLATNAKTMSNIKYIGRQMPEIMF